MRYILLNGVRIILAVGFIKFYMNTSRLPVVLRIYTYTKTLKNPFLRNFKFSRNSSRTSRCKDNKRIKTHYVTRLLDTTNLYAPTCLFTTPKRNAYEIRKLCTHRQDTNAFV